MELSGRPMSPELRGSNEGAVDGCVGSNCGGPGKNIDRAGYQQTGGSYVKQHVDKSLLSALGPRSGYMGALGKQNCGTNNPLNLKVSTQHGGNNGCSNPTARYGYTGDDDLAKYGSYAVATPLSGGRRRRKYGKKRKQTRKRNHSSKKRRGGRVKKRSRRRISKKNKRQRRTRAVTKRRKRMCNSCGFRRCKCNCRTRPICRNCRIRNCKCIRRRRYRTRKMMKGGYHQWQSNTPNTAYTSAPVAVSSKNSALANPSTYDRHIRSRDNYNHMTGKSFPTGVYDQDVKA